MRQYQLFALLLCALLALGCEDITPAPAPQPEPTPEPAPAPFVAAPVYVELVTEAWEKTGNDNPSPEPTDVCPNCDGQGWIGDGVTKLVCAECGGSGKKLAKASPIGDNRCSDPDCPCGPICACGDECRCSEKKAGLSAVGPDVQSTDGQKIWVQRGGVDGGKWTVGAVGVDDDGIEWVLEEEGWRPTTSKGTENAKDDE